MLTLHCASNFHRSNLFGSARLRSMKALLPQWRAVKRSLSLFPSTGGPAIRPRIPFREHPPQSPASVSPRPAKCRPINAPAHRTLVTTAPPVADEPTIYALSTAPGRAAIAIIRISGPAALHIYHALCPGRKPPKPRVACVRTLYHPRPRSGDTENVLDSSALVLFFPGPRTVTGEDVLELHVHGGSAVVRAILGAIPLCFPSSGSSSNGNRIRYAEPGEFTRRAFMNGRLDLTRVEALGDVLAATTEQQRRLSVRGTVGGLAKRYEAWRRDLLYARGELEALIDFSEDQHFDESPAELCISVAGQVAKLRALLGVHRDNAVKGELLRNGIKISLLGAPNAGKSSLLNRVVGREAAIVSREPGTTRDVVEVGLDLGGYLCLLGDTAGLRKAKEAVAAVQMEGGASEVIGKIEQEGMRRAKLRAEESDVVIAVLSFETVNGELHLQLDEEVLTTAAELVRTKGNTVVVVNKMDKVAPEIVTEAKNAVLAALPGLLPELVFPISCLAESATHVKADADAGQIQTFLTGLIRHFDSLTTALAPDGDLSIWQESLGATERHRLLLEDCIGYLDAFLEEVQHATASVAADEKGDEKEADIVLAAEHLRSAAQCLAKITGQGEAGDVEEVLGVVFEKFCVGK
ncbi:hypothetical protein LTR62_007189 [Meristemomyces frigidus]|uniref:Uncharacterized protein n=1 Tax=Meristemomyces frigidus TaxID=1508187 RepID=A0AAN7TB18_9PEZI|nr:hypothetical protein LTR62_007189 [Meristemomyces frigidus]